MAYCKSIPSFPRIVSVDLVSNHMKVCLTAECISIILEGLFCKPTAFSVSFLSFLKSHFAILMLCPRMLVDVYLE